MPETERECEDETTAANDEQGSSVAIEAVEAQNQEDDRQLSEGDDDGAEAYNEESTAKKKPHKLGVDVVDPDLDVENKQAIPASTLSADCSEIQQRGFVSFERRQFSLRDVPYAFYRMMLGALLSKRHGPEQETLEVLLADWQSLRDRNRDMVILLGCLDQCDDTALAFLSQLHRYLTTSDFSMKIIITTAKDTPKERSIIGFLKIFPENLITEIGYTFPTRVPIELGFELSILIQEVDCQNVGIECLREVFTGLLSQTANDQKLSLLLIGWLKSHRKPVAAATRLLRVSKEIGPGSIFKVILAGIPEERQRWAEKLIPWMLSSFRPLRTFEIHYLSDLCLDTHNPTDELIHLDSLNTRQSLSHALRYFGGILTVVHDEIQFSHPEIRDWLSSESCSNDLWYRAKPESCRHLDILEICLTHLDKDTGAPDDWTVLLPYVTEFWTEHYKFAEAKARRSLQVLERVVQSPPTLRRWMEAHALLLTPFTKPLETS
ncbi:hypothetical protein CSAL01_01796 [Colletotrichum salicis]|uniref:Uncharacterized protein n=1 Tax=Colletotrichum salicis TaxID=1209931 RepID=A0A135T6X1_9PEZI|nr:hypothetical protein CSAL01_01796 [Colletotrichum salicis]